MTDAPNADRTQPLPPPFQPVTLLASAALLGPMSTGFVLASNDHRLGLKDRVPLTFYAFFFLALFTYMAVAWLHAEHVLTLNSRTGWLAYRLLSGLLALAATVPWFRSQQQAFLRSGRASGSPALYTMIGLLFSLGMDALVWQMFVHPH